MTTAVNAVKQDETGIKTIELFADTNTTGITQKWLASNAVLLRGYALANESALYTALKDVINRAPLRHMVTPGGFTMSVAMTNCGKYGWVSDHNGYRYDALDPLNGKPWPRMPESFLSLARNTAEVAGFDNFYPEVCLVNCYVPGAKLSLHQDKDELDFKQPIVSVSLGVPAVFLFGGMKRKDSPNRVPLVHGDVVVWGGPDRLRYHGVLPLKESQHPFAGNQRINLTFRKAV